MDDQNSMPQSPPPEGFEAFANTVTTPGTEPAAHPGVAQEPDAVQPPEGFTEFAGGQSPEGFEQFAGTQPDADEAKYTTPGQQALATAEGAAQGVLGPLATAGELGLSKLGVPGVSAEDQKQRAEHNPLKHSIAQAATLAASMYTGIGEAGLAANAAEHLLPAATSILGKVGSAALSGAIQSGIVQAGDEMSKAMLGQGDPETPVSSALSHIGAAGLLGGAFGGLFNISGQGISKGLEAVENAKMGTKAENLLAGMGMATKAYEAGVPLHEAEEHITKAFSDSGMGDHFNYKNYKDGVNLYYNGLQNAVNHVVGNAVNSAAGTVGNMVGGVPGAVGAFKASDKYLLPILEKVLDKPLMGANKLLAPAVMNALSKGETSGLYDLMNYATSVSKGAKAINNGVESIFKGGGQQVVNEIASDRDKEKIKDYIEQGGMNKEMQNATDQPPEGFPGFAEGGKVPQMPVKGANFSALYPDQNILASSAKSRVSTYLTSLKPQSIQQKLPYDKAMPSAPAERAYNRAVEIAAAPNSILKHIKDGTLLAEHVKHMTSMYPELTSHLQKKLTERMMESQLEEEHPSYKTKMAMSMFLGSALESNMTPGGIQAAQMTYAPKASPQPGPGQNKSGVKKGTSTLGKSNKEYSTLSQAGEQDRTVRD